MNLIIRHLARFEFNACLIARIKQRLFAFSCLLSSFSCAPTFLSLYRCRWKTMDLKENGFRCPLLESLWWYCLNIKAASDMSWVNNSLCRGMILTQQNTLRLHAGRGFQSQWLNSRLASWLRRHHHPCDSNFICPQLSSYCLMQLYRNEVLLIQQETYSCLLGSKPLPLMTAHSFLLSDIQTADMVSKDERKI